MGKFNIRSSIYTKRGSGAYTLRAKLPHFAPFFGANLAGKGCTPSVRTKPVTG